MNLIPGSTDAAIVASTVDLARTLGLRTVAEGVENPEVLQYLIGLGCDIGQGFLFSRPGAADQMLSASAQSLLLWPQPQSQPEPSAQGG
jgi:EAL domain-containing protein (putative c-di-GMP-specific phosphodiesterase class I)